MTLTPKAHSPQVHQL